ncbi:MAG: hypothetical protein ACI35O_12580 [Bacillaceae bacterium]
MSSSTIGIILNEKKNKVLVGLLNNRISTVENLSKNGISPIFIQDESNEFAISSVSKVEDHSYRFVDVQTMKKSERMYVKEKLQKLPHLVTTYGPFDKYTIRVNSNGDYFVARCYLDNETKDIIVFEIEMNKQTTTGHLYRVPLSSAHKIEDDLDDEKMANKGVTSVEKEINDVPFLNQREKNMLIHLATNGSSISYDTFKSNHLPMLNLLQ